MATYYVRKDRALDGSEGPPDASGLFYWFDGSDAAASDPDGVWTDETNTDDSDITTVGYTTTAGSSVANFLKIEGTNAPASGGTISSVKAWVRYGAGNVSEGSQLIVSTDGGSELLLNAGILEGTVMPAWKVSPVALNAPTGGWTWAKVQALEAKIYNQSGITDRLEVAAIGIMVHTTTEGESATDPFRTIDDAANEVAAGDTVVVGAGVYRELVTMDTAGTNGSEITFVADVDGSLGSGDPGLVIISAYDDEQSAATRASCLDPNEKDFIVWRGFVMTGGTTAVVYKLGTNNINYEDCVWEDCVFITGNDDGDYAVYIDFNAATTPTNQGPTWRRCIVTGGGFRFLWDGNETAEQDLKVTFESCTFTGVNALSNIQNPISWDRSAAGTYGSGGVTINNCLFDSKFVCVWVDAGTSTTYPVAVTNSLFRYCINGLNKSTTNDGALTSAYNTFAAVATPYTNVTTGTGDREQTTDPGLLGGVGDYPLWRFWGWSPYKPFEPIRLQDDSYVHSVIGDGDTATAPAFDLYNEDRPMGGRAGERYDYYYFDASDAGPTDDEAVWTDDANAFDGDDATAASVAVAGGETLNELRGEGTTAPASGGTIASVEARYYWGSVTANRAVRIYTDSEDELIDSYATTAASAAWSAWRTLTAPTGGWTWAKVQALELITYLLAAGSMTFGAAEVRVTSAPVGQDDRGAVEGRARPEVETTTVRTGSNAIRLEGAGYAEWIIPVAASSTTVTIYGQYDGTYTGTLPTLEVLNIPGQSDQSDVQTGASGSWEELSATFTPTAAGICRVRFVSSDTSAAGKCFADDLTVA